MNFDDNNPEYGSVNKVKVSKKSRGDKKHSYRMILITVLVLLVALGGGIIAMNENLQQTMKRTLSFGGGEESPSESSTQYVSVDPVESTISSREQAWLEVSAENPTVSLNETVTLHVSAFSEGQDIAGYDMLFNINTDMFELESVASELSDFTIFQFDRGSYIAITAIKALGQNDPTVFDDTNLIEVVLKPKKRGSSVVTVLSEYEEEKTQLVDSDVNVLYPQIESEAILVE